MYVVTAVLLIPIIYLLTVVEFLYFYKKKGRPRLQDWMRLIIFLMLVLNFMSIANNANGMEKITFVNRQISINNSDFTMIIIIFALVAMDMAYIINNTFKRQLVYDFTYTLNRKDIVFILLIMTTLFYAYLILTGAIGFGNDSNNSSVISFFKMLSRYLVPFFLILSAYIVYIEDSKNKLYIKIFYIALLSQILLGFLSGMKEYSLAPILYVLIVFFLAGKNLSKKFIYIGFFLIIFLYPINNAYRTVIGTPSLNTGSSIVNMGIAINNVMTDPILDTLQSGTDSYSSRGEMFPFLLYSIDLEPQWTYFKYMERYIYIPISWFIPSGIWQDKPKADIGGVLYEYITGERTGTAVTPTTLGWSYLEGGIFFVFTIFLLIGFIFEFIDNKNLKKPIILLFYVILLHKAIKPEWDAYFMISSLIPMFIIYFGMLKIIGVTRHEN